MDYLHHASFGIGVLVIVFGVLGGLVRFVRAEFSAARGLVVDEERKKLRHVLGYYLLLGLEFLIAADIIDTLMKPSVQDLIVLGAIVLIRTIISFSLNAEVGRVTPCAPRLERHENGAHGVSRPTHALAHPARDGAGRPL